MLDWVILTVGRAGYLGIAALMLAENIFPPIPSEVIMPLAGYVAAQGQLSLAGVFLAGSLGSLAGALFWYGIGRWIGIHRLKRVAVRHGRWLTLEPSDIDRADAWFARYGWLAVMIGRLVPGVRTLISVPAGVAAMPMVPFLLASLVGTLAWSGFLALAGYLLAAKYGVVAGPISLIGSIVLGLAIVLYIYRVVTFKGRPRVR